MIYNFNSESGNPIFSHNHLAINLGLIGIIHEENKKIMVEPLKILLADDEEIVSQTISGYLVDLSHQVDKVYDALKTLKAVEEKEYDLAIFDIRMPGMDGISLLSKLREIRPEMLVVIIASHGNMDIAVKALKLGAIDFLTKPIRLIEIDAILEKAERLRKGFLQHISDMDQLNKTNEQLKNEIARRIEAEMALRKAEERYNEIIEKLNSRGRE